MDKDIVRQRPSDTRTELTDSWFTTLVLFELINFQGLSFCVFGVMLINVSRVMHGLDMTCIVVLIELD